MLLLCGNRAALLELLKVLNRRAQALSANEQIVSAPSLWSVYIQFFAPA